MSAGRVFFSQRRREYVVEMTFTESELMDLAGAFGSADGFYDECMSLAAELHNMNHPEDDE